MTQENWIYAGFMALAIAGYFIKKRAMRWIIMLGSLTVIGFLQMGCPSPLGAIQNIAMKPLAFAKSLPFWIKLGIVILPTLFLGPVFCGWVCPKGVIQELLYRKQLNLKISEKFDRWLRLLPMVVLIAVIASPLMFKFKIFNSDVSPFSVIFNLMGSPFALGFLIVILISSLFIFRPFCKYVCPVGALLNWVSKIGFFKLGVKSDCTGCKLCQKACGMEALTAPNRDGENLILNKSRCIACGECRMCCNKGCLYC
jgi:polyferredoxin